MKKIIISVASLLVASALILSSCKKKEEIAPITTDDSITASEQQASITSSADNSNVEANVDDAIDNISSSLDGARVDAENDCSVTVEVISVTSGVKQKKFTYDGSECGFFKISKKGTVLVTLTKGNSFKDSGAVYTVEYQGYAVTQGGKTMTMTGTHTVTNLTGGLPRFVISRPKDYTVVTRQITGLMKLTFDTTLATREWNVARKISYGNNDGVLSMTITGFGSADGYDNLVTWGTNRFGNAFYNQITTPIILNSTCGFRRPSNGGRKHTFIDKNGDKIEGEVSITKGGDGCGKGMKIKIKNKKGKEKEVTYDID